MYIYNIVLISEDKKIFRMFYTNKLVNTKQLLDGLKTLYSNPILVSVRTTYVKETPTEYFR